MIRARFHVTVAIPELVWKHFRDSQMFERSRIEATLGHDESGTDFYHDPFEWAIFGSRVDAMRCEKRLEAVMASFLEEALNIEAMKAAEGES